MKFDSTAYLKYFLKDKMRIPDEYIDYCCMLLNGFIIRPGSIKYDDENKLLTLNMAIPNSELWISKAVITDQTINLKLSIKDAVINVNCGIYSQTVKLSMIINYNDNPNKGIYYYDSRAFNVKEVNYQGMFSYYDAETLKVINDVYNKEFLRLGVSIEDAIGVEERKINELGFVADTVIYNDSNLLKKGQSILDIAQIINDQFINFNYDDIMNRLSMFSKGAKKEIGPIKIRK